MKVATFDEMARRPVGRFTLHGNIAHFCVGPRLWGLLLWGRTTSADMATAVRSLALELSPVAEPHDSLVDVGRVSSLEPGAFDILGEYVRTHFDGLAQRVVRLALVRPHAGLTGAVVAGFFDVVAPPYTVRHFGDTREALAWLELDDADATRDALAEVVAIASQTPALLTAATAAMRVDLAGATAEDVARRLGMSERTLQRRLADHESTFHKLLGDARIRAAQEQMLDGDDPLNAIAISAGFSSIQHFSTSFRRAIGESPSSWRRRQRGR